MAEVVAALRPFSAAALPAEVRPSAACSASSTSAPPAQELAATVALSQAQLDTDPISARSIQLASNESVRVARRVPPNHKRPIVLIAAGFGGCLLLALTIWVILRDKAGNEVGRIQIPEGGSATIRDEAAFKPAPLPETPPPARKPSPDPTANNPREPRWPLRPSNPADVQKLLESNAILTLRTPATTGDGSVEHELRPGQPIPSAPATVVRAVILSADDTLLEALSRLTDLEVLVFPETSLANRSDVTVAGVRQLAALTNLRHFELRLPYGACREAQAILKSMPQLKFFHPAYATADDWAPAIAACPSIIEVNGFRSNFSPAGLAHLAKMPQLQRVDLRDGHDLTSADIERFAAAVPGCRITWGAGNNPRVIEPRTPTQPAP